MKRQQEEEYQRTKEIFLQESNQSAEIIEVLLKKLHRAETILHHIAENACNGWPKSVREYRDGQYYRYDVEDVEWRVRDERKEARTKEKVKEIANELGFKVKFNGDPRGAAICFILPSGAHNSWDGETWRIHW